MRGFIIAPKSKEMMQHKNETSWLVVKRMNSPRGFSLLELIVVMSITSLLAGLLMPALSSVRENARRVLCGSNQRQLGQAITMYSADRRNKLPVASTLDLPEPDASELILVRHGVRDVVPVYFVDGKSRTFPKPLKDSTWDGLGKLYQWHYCDESEPFYCPSHQGKHTHAECEDQWETDTNPHSLYGNFHYVGHKDWRTGNRRSLLQGNQLVLVTDGLRTKSDYNHGVGYNELRGDGSVSWRDDVVIRSELSIDPPDDLLGRQHLDDLIYEIFSR